MLSTVRYLFLGTENVNVTVVVVAPGSGVNEKDEPDDETEPFDIDNVIELLPPEV